MYKLATELQGDVIPHVLYAGLMFQNTVYGLTMEKIDGKHPKSIAAEDRKLLKAAAADAIKKFHQKKLLHGDISDKNVLVDNTGKIYLVDLGFASQSADQSDQKVEEERLFTLFS